MDNTDTPSGAFVKAAAEIDYKTVDAAEGLQKGVLIDESDGAPTFAIRRFTIDPATAVPKHTNAVEHEQHVLSGTYTVGFRDPETGEETEQTVAAGDSIFVPAGTVHWYRNESQTQGSFLCAVPNGEDSIEVVDE